MKKSLSRRAFLKAAGLGATGGVLAACQPKTVVVKETVEVEKVVKETVKETVIVGGTPKMVEKEVTKVVEKVVTATPAPEVVTLKVNAYAPSEWTERSAEHPNVTNAPRILAERFKELEPNIEIEWIRYQGPEGGTETDTMAWLSALVAAGAQPDITGGYHENPINQGWVLPLDDYLSQPNPYAPQYATWKDVFYPTLMKSLVFGDGKTYCAPVSTPYPGVFNLLAYNVEIFDELGLKPPSTWTEQMEVCEALYEAGVGHSPYVSEAKDGNIWPLPKQILKSLVQDEAAQMDTDGDKFVGSPEALPAFRAGLVGPLTPDYRTGWKEFKKLSDTWIDGWATSDLLAMWKNGDIGMRYLHTGTYTAELSDPFIEFERGGVPLPAVTKVDDVPGANDPPEWTPGDGKIPADQVTALQGSDILIYRITEGRGTLDAAIKWNQWITEPENNAFLVNEPQNWIPAAKDAPVSPIFVEIASYRLPKWEFNIEWWGMCLYWDSTHFAEIRKIFVSWATGQIDEATFFKRQQEETVAGADRYAATIKTG